MPGQKLNRKTHHSGYHEERMFIRALEGNNLDVSTFSHTKKEKNYAPFLYHVGISRNEKINKIRKTCTRRLWTEQKQEGSVLLTRFATGSESRPQVQAVPSLEQA